MEPDLALKCQTVAYLQVPESEAKRLAKMPTLVTTYNEGPLDGTYILPPILYPDGNYYLKVPICVKYIVFQNWWVVL